MSKTIEKVQLAIQKGFEGEILSFTDKLLAKKKLHPELQKKLESYGNNPVAEPEKYALIQKNKLELAKLLLTTEELTSKFTSMEVGDFIHEVVKKVSYFQEEDGTFKYTPKTEMCRLPNFIEVEDLVKKSEKVTKLNTEYTQNPTNKKTKKELEDAAKELGDKKIEISGLNFEDLSDWEKELVKMQIYYSALDATLSAVGKSLGNL